MADKHLDCRNFAPVDAVMGLCLRSKAPVQADAASCEKLDRMPKCGLCAKYAPSASKPSLGTCGAEKHEPSAYADLPAVTCRDFRWKKP
jgi:4-hydroxyphenylacetate decarboxylase small subunit